MSNIQYNPDVLSCIANLSNDEVFTPPHIANQMLDLLPNDLWSDKTVTFLDPCCKSGVFLREIAKRLIKGLEIEFPNLQERLNHIFSKQLYGIAITELTALLSRRSVYCSKLADGKYSVCEDFNRTIGNILHNNTFHTWKGNKCSYCGATKAVYERGSELESYAYEFIHKNNPEEIFNMKFDVIVGNPPYQLNVGIEKDNYAIPLYHLFIQQAKKLNPRFLTMIIPARWYAGGRGLDEFRQEMLKDDRLRKVIDYPNATDCFPGVDISGGVCYFLWERNNSGACEITTIKGKTVESKMERHLLEEGCDTFIRFNRAISILRKVRSHREDSFSKLVSPQTPFGLISSFKEYKEKPFLNSVELYTTRGVKNIKRQQILRNEKWVRDWKVYIAAAYGERGSFPYLFLAKPFIGKPNSVCTQAYLMIGTFMSEEICKNVISYIETKFFRFCIMLKKNTQHAMRDKYSLVPVQDFSHEWTDEKLYKKYNLSTQEIAFIDSMVRPMESRNAR